MVNTVSSAGVKHTRRRSTESQAQFKQELLAYAKELYREKGYEALSIRAVTEAFAMSPMSFYGYFSSKQDLVKHIWNDFFTELLSQLLAAGHGKRSPTQVLEAHVQAFLDYWEAHPDQYRMVYVTDVGATGEELSTFNDTPVSRQLFILTRERVLACARGKAVAEKAVRLVVDRMFVHGLGYLHGLLAVQRYPLVDRAKLRRAVVRDIVEMVVKAVA